MYIYYCWITALLPNYQDGIISGLAKRGYMVGPAAKDGGITLTNGKCPSALISLSVYRPEETTVENIYKDVTGILQELNYYYYSVVISLSHEATWAGANFDPEAIKAASKGTPPPLPPGTKKNVN